MQLFESLTFFETELNVNPLQSRFHWFSIIDYPNLIKTNWNNLYWLDFHFCIWTEFPILMFSTCRICFLRKIIHYISIQQITIICVGILLVKYRLKFEIESNINITKQFQLVWEYETWGIKNEKKIVPELSNSYFHNHNGIGNILSGSSEKTLFWVLFLDRLLLHISKKSFE